MSKNGMLRTAGALTIAAACLLSAHPAAAGFKSARPTAAGCDCSALPTLGRAFEFSVFGLGGDDVTMSGSSFADGGNMAIASGGKKIGMSGGATIDGYIRRHSGTTIDLWGAGATGGGVLVQDMDGAKADLLAAATAFTGMAPDQTLAIIGSNLTINGNGCVKIVRVNGNIILNDAQTLTIDAGKDEYVIFNVYGAFNASGSGNLALIGGIPSHHVLFNMVGGGDNVTISGSANANATFINPTKKISASGSGTSKGAYYASGIDISGTASFFGKPFLCGCLQPETAQANIEQPSAPIARSIGKSRFFLSTFDLGTGAEKLESFYVDSAGVILDENDDPIVDYKVGIKLLPQIFQSDV